MKETLPTLSWIQSLRDVDTPTISNAIELLKLRPKEEGFAPLEIRCLYPELGRMCGYAVTAQVETVSRTGRKQEETFIELFEATFRSPKPAVIVLQEIGERSNFAAHSGEVMATIFKQLGGIGLVSDSACVICRKSRRWDSTISPVVLSPAMRITVSCGLVSRFRFSDFRFSPVTCCMGMKTGCFKFLTMPVRAYGKRLPLCDPENEP